MRSSLLLLAAVAAAAPAAAQDSDTTDSRTSVSWFVAPGILRPEWDQLGAAFTAAGYAALPRDLFAIGGGGYVLHDRMVFGGEGQFFLSGRVGSTPAGRQAKIEGGQGFFTLGYAVIAGSGARLYPLIGLGGQGVTVKLDQPAGTGVGPDVNNPTFNDVLLDPGQRTRLTAGAFALQAGMGLDLTLGRRERRGGRGWHGLMVGVRAGYAWAPAVSDWKMYDIEVLGGPDRLISGWFVRASLGGTGTPHRRRR